MHRVYPQILHNHCFQFLLGITVVPREIKNKGYAILFLVGRRRGGGEVNKEDYEKGKFSLGSGQSLLRSLALPELARGRG